MPSSVDQRQQVRSAHIQPGLGPQRRGLAPVVGLVIKKVHQQAEEILLGGHTPPGCRRRIWLTREVFIGEVRGLWQYALDFATESVFIEDSDLPSGPLLTEVNYEESE